MNPVRVSARRHDDEVPAPAAQRYSPDGGVAVEEGPLRVHRLPRHPWQGLVEGRSWTVAQLVADVVAANLAVLFAVALAGFDLTHATLLLLPLFTPVAMAVRGLYRRRARDAVMDIVAPVLGAVSTAAMITLAVQAIFFSDPDAFRQLVPAWAATMVLVCAGRGALARLQQHARVGLGMGRPTLIVGAGSVGVQMARRLDAHPEYGLIPVGYLDDNPAPADVAGDRRLPVIGSTATLAQAIDATGADHVILAFSASPDRTLVGLVRACEEAGVEVSLVPRLFESMTDRVALERLGGLPLVGLRAVDPKGWQFRIKYALDRPIALLAVLLVSPLMLLAAIAVKLSSPGPILYRQRRVGRDGRRFDMLKFRSMRQPSPADVGFVPASGEAPGGIEGLDRRTTVGRFLRRSAIDELPQLFNVLRGDMSIVGPRPERPEYVALFELEHRRYADRHRVKSGITGWAQVHGLRGQTSLSDRVEWDNAYIENWSLWLDVKTLVMTAGAVARSGEHS